MKFFQILHGSRQKINDSTASKPHHSVMSRFDAARLLGTSRKVSKHYVVKTAFIFQIGNNIFRIDYIEF